MKTNKPIVLLALLLWLIYFSTKAQTIPQYAASLLPSPNSSELIKGVNVPVNLYNGTAHVNLPLGTVSGRQLSVPISISYNTAGVKAQQKSGWAGLGWNISAGGAITRIVRGLPDEEVNGYCGTNNTGEKVNDPLTSTYADNVVDGIWDSQPDLFFFNVLGRSGRFVLDDDGNALTIPLQNVIINAGICNGSTSEWEIIDENGIHYFFGGGGNYNESTKTVQSNTNVDITYVSTWYLKRIESPDQNDVINLQYSSGNQYAFEMRYESQVDEVDNNGLSCHYPGTIDHRSNNQIITVFPKYLTSILSSLGSAHFSFDGIKIDEVVIKNYQNTELLKFDFDYYHPVNDDEYSGSSLVKHYNANNLKRVTLNNTIPLYKFDYKCCDEKNYEFFTEDHWGYVNGSILYQTDIIPSFPGFSGVNKSSNMYGIKGVLESIEYESGRLTEFNYAVNTIVKAGKDFYVGGVRIASITENDGNGNSYTTTYSYTQDGSNLSSGQIYKEPIYHKYLNYYNAGNVLNETNLMRFSHSLVELHDVNGYHVGYSRVTETNPNGIKKVYEFENFSDHPDLAANKYIFDPGSSGGRTTYIVNDEPPFSPDTYQGWKRGRLKKTQIIDSSGKIFKETNNYQYGYTTSSNSITGRVVEKDDNDYNCNTIPQQDYRISDYELISENQFLTSFDEIYYVDDNSTVKSITTTTNLGYTNNGFITSKTIIYHDGSEYKTTYKFPFQFSDFISSPPAAMAGIIKMKDEHVWSVPIETVNFKKDGSKFYAYKGRINLFNEDFKTSEVKSFESSELLSDFYISGGLTVGNFINNPNGGFGYHPNYESLVTYNYLTNGNLSSQITRDNVTTQYLWGYNNNYITAEIVNPGTDERRTDYTYIPMVGVSSETDPNGYTISYEYDHRNRLELIKDDDGNVVQAYDYHYKEPEELEVSTNNLSFGSGSSNSNVNVISNVDWSTAINYTSGSGWITVNPSTPQSGDVTLNISVTSNSGSQRTGKVIVSDASGTGLPDQEINITQAAPTSLTISPNGMIMIDSNDPSSSPFSISITSNVSWTVSKTLLDNPSVNWMTVSTTSGTNNQTLYLDFYAQPPSGESWRAQIDVSGGGIDRSLYVFWQN